MSVCVCQMALSGWICVVTGASRGIGRGIALQLSEAGATVYITGRQEKTLKQTAAEVWKLAPSCIINNPQLREGDIDFMLLFS